MSKIIINIAGVHPITLTFKSFEELKRKCLCNGQNKNPKTHFAHVCKPSVCTNWFSDTPKCKKKYCPLLKIGN